MKKYAEVSQLEIANGGPDLAAWLGRAFGLIIVGFALVTAIKVSSLAFEANG